ncbi:MAG: hypothetical protein KME27_11025 [Lyngbya sp. HA4199-MV5]|jgi:hypothetical protein|nr:hypothetical protein [Lyngbya sp. HA4199-MV5]
MPTSNKIITFEAAIAALNPTRFAALKPKAKLTLLGETVLLMLSEQVTTKEREKLRVAIGRVQRRTGKSRSDRTKAEKRIHYIGIPCKADLRAGGRWHSSTMSSNSNPQAVTCKGCLKVMAKPINFRDEK